MPTKRETVKEAESESGTERDVKGVKDGRCHEMRYSHHSMGSYKTGTHHHDHHRGKGD